jgi:hypothetical protein
LIVDFKVTQDVNLELNVGVEDDDAVKELAKLISSGLDLAKFQAKAVLMQQPEMQPLLDLINSLKAGQKEKSVVVTGKVDGQAIDKALSKGK